MDDVRDVLSCRCCWGWASGLGTMVKGNKIRTLFDGINSSVWPIAHNMDSAVSIPLGRGNDIFCLYCQINEACNSSYLFHSPFHFHAQKKVCAKWADATHIYVCVRSELKQCKHFSQCSFSLISFVRTNFYLINSRIMAKNETKKKYSSVLPNYYVFCQHVAMESFVRVNNSYWHSNDLTDSQYHSTCSEKIVFGNRTRTQPRPNGDERLGGPGIMLPWPINYRILAQ